MACSFQRHAERLNLSFLSLQSWPWGFGAIQGKQALLAQGAKAAMMINVIPDNEKAIQILDRLYGWREGAVGHISNIHLRQT